MQPPPIFADRYRLEDRLGEGAFGVVYSAFDQGLLQRRVAIKLLRSEEAGSAAEERAERFITELRLAGALRHPHIATVYDAGEWQGQLYMVQELVEGRDLDQFVTEHGPVPVELALRLAAQMIDALGQAHEQGVLHRDIKPGNLLIDQDHRVVVVDFGLATSAAPGDQARTGSVGTPGYAAPEQVRGRCDARADQFSLAAVIYRMLTGVAPFVGRNLTETLRRTLLVNPEPPSRLRPDLPVGLDRPLMRALSKSPGDRYPTLREFGAELLSHELVAGMGTPDATQGALLQAATGGSLVLVSGPEPGPWQRRLRSALALVLGPRAQETEAEEAPPQEIMDPRAEVFPGPETPVLLRLGDDLAMDRMREASDGVRAALVTGHLLVYGLGPEDPLLRRLLSQIRALSPSSPPPVTVVGPRFELAAVRAAERRGLSLLERDPAGLLQELADELPALTAAERPPLPARPYKFLSSFEAGDEAIFFGRDVELARVNARILAHPITLLYGASGAGKTSLVQAALAPRLRRAGHRVTITRVFDDPIAEIGAAAGLSASAEELPRRIAEEARAGRLMVVFVDQLEELFLRFPRPSRERIAADLRAALDLSEGHLRLVLCLRADYLARLGELKEILPLSFEVGLWLEPLSSASARAAIEGPAGLHGIGVEPALIDAMLADLMGDGVDPPQLQLVCDALWEARAPGQLELRLADYRALGEARDILARHLRKTLEGLPLEDQSPARALLKAMVTAADTRSVKRLAEIARGAGLSEAEARRLLETLARLRLVRPLEREDGVWYELTHEVLAAEIGRWLSEDDRRLQRVRELLEQGLRGHEQLGLLLSRAQLSIIEPMAHRLTLSEAERELIARSRADERRGRRRIWTLVAAGLLALLVGVLGGRALWLQGQAFARASEGSLSFSRWGSAVERPTAQVTVYRGAADPWWVDGLLGFPREPYQTGWSLTDMRPELRDALRAGMDLPEPERASAFLAEALGPVAATQERIVAGKLDGLGERLHAVADTPGLGPGEALGLVPALALGETSPEPLLEDLLEIATQQAAILRVPGGSQRLDGRVGRPMGLLLLRADPAALKVHLEAQLRDESGPELLGELLAVAGDPEQVAALEPSLRSVRAANVEGALLAMAYSGRCSAMPEIRAMLQRGGGVVQQSRVQEAWLELTTACGGPEDVPLLEDMLVAIASGSAYDDPLNRVLSLLYSLDPAHVVELATRYAEGLQAGRRTTVTPFAYQADPALVATLPPGSPQQLLARLYLGDAEAVWPSLEFGLRDRASPSGGSWLWALALYRGPALQAQARALVADPDQPVYVTLPMLPVAAGGGGDEAARAVGLGLASADLVQVQIALNYLSAWDAALPPDLGGESRQAALARDLIALRRGGLHGDRFQEVLEDPAARALEVWLALEGQRRLWGDDPGSAVEALRSPFARVRLAGILTLADQDELPSLDAQGDPWLMRAHAQVRWAHHALRLEEELRQRARAALDADQPLRARQITRLLRTDQGALKVLGRVLAPELPAPLYDEREQETDYLHMLADLRLGVGTSTEWPIAYLSPRMWGRMVSEPTLADRQDEYLFRVLTGRSPPLTVEDP